MHQPGSRDEDSQAGATTPSLIAVATGAAPRPRGVAPRYDWLHKALCLRFPDINFVPDPFLGESSVGPKSVCYDCPVMMQCRDSRIGLGIWGGEDEVEYLVRIQGQIAPALDCECGHPRIVTQLGTVCTSCGKVEL